MHEFPVNPTSLIPMSKLKKEDPMRSIILTLISIISANANAVSTNTVSNFHFGTEVNTLSIVGNPDELVPGMRIQTFRKKGTSLIPTGKGYIDSVFNDKAVAVVISEETFTSKRELQPYPGIMAGDVVQPRLVSISPTQIIVPNVSIPYGTLFLDPGGLPFRLRIV